MPLKNLAES